MSDVDVELVQLKCSNEFDQRNQIIQEQFQLFVFFEPVCIQTRVDFDVIRLDQAVWIN